MRRMLPRPLLRLPQQAARPVITAPFRRPNSTLAPPSPASSTSTTSTESESQPSSSTSGSSDSAESTDQSASSSTAAKNPKTARSPRTIPPTFIAKPAAITPSFASLRRTVPMKVKERREQWPEHPTFTREPYSDPEVFDVDRPTSKRLPHEMEIQFEHMRKLGFFPGDPAVARTHFLDILRQWRGRIRGQEGQVWDSKKKEWQTASRLVFFLEKMNEKGLPYPDAEANRVAGVGLLSDSDVFLSGAINPGELKEEDFRPEAIKRVLRVRADEYRFTLDRGIFEYHRKDLTEGSIVMDHEKLRKRHDELFNWPLIRERYANELSTDKRRSYRTRVVGHRVYLPNITVRLTRNFTPPDQPYDPYIATFRIPPSMTKQDLRSYLKAVYDLDVTFVRTAVYWGEIVRDQRNGRRHRQKGGVYNYKKAVVGLYEPFHYPDDVHELRALGRKQGRGDKMYRTRINGLNEQFYLKEQRDFRRKLVQAVYKRSSYGHRSKGVGQSIPRVLRKIGERRRAREHAIDAEANRMRRGASAQAA